MQDRQPSSERRVQIADAALAAIAEEGLGRFTTAAIARRVGISEGALFRHFTSKAEIVGAAIERVGDILAGDYPDPALEPLPRLGRFLEARVATLAEHPGIARVFFSEQLAQAAGDGGAQRARELQLRSVGFVRSCLEEARSRADIRADVDIDDLLVWVHGSVLALITLGELEAGPALSSRRVARLWASIVALVHA